MPTKNTPKIETATERKERIDKAAKERVKKSKKAKEKELNDPKNLNNKGQELFDAILGAIIEDGELVRKQTKKKRK
ncbi:MAG: hypothetical protein JNL49_01870 [Bacteroidia bacterium]|nr:hypothetical protein [Bacteroidia bacterium]